MSLRTKHWIFAVGLSLSVLLASCGPPDPSSPAIFHSSADYAQALADVQKLTQGPFEAMHEGFPSNAEEKENLKEASHLIDGMIVYNPQTYAPYILKGL